MRFYSSVWKVWGKLMMHLNGIYCTNQWQNPSMWSFFLHCLTASPCCTSQLHRPTVTEYKDNHSGFLIRPLNILLPRRAPGGASDQKSTQHYWTSRGSHKRLSIDVDRAEGWWRSKSLAWGKQRRWRREEEKGWRICHLSPQHVVRFRVPTKKQG